MTFGNMFVRFLRPVVKNSEYNLHSLVSQRKFTGVSMVFKLMSGLADVNVGKFYRIVVARTVGSSEKISYCAPKTNTR